jgi:large subunit ribosomal protein L4
VGEIPFQFVRDDYSFVTPGTEHGATLTPCLTLDSLALPEATTAALRTTLGKIGLVNALVIAGPEVDGNFRLAARNIPNVDVLPNAGLNVYDVLRRRTLVLTKDAVEAINARFAEKEAA